MRKQGGKFPKNAIITSNVTLDILDRMVDGASVSEIAKHHGLSEKTVRDYFNAIRGRLKRYELSEGNLGLSIRRPPISDCTKSDNDEFYGLIDKEDDPAVYPTKKVDWCPTIAFIALLLFLLSVFIFTVFFNCEIVGR